MPDIYTIKIIMKKVMSHHSWIIPCTLSKITINQVKLRKNTMCTKESTARKNYKTLSQEY